MQCFQPAVHPHCRRNGAVLDAVAGLGIVGDDLPGAAPVPDVELVENGISVLCRPDTIRYFSTSDFAVSCITVSHNVHKFTLDVTYVQK